VSSSADKGVSWSRPAASSLPNPNAPFATVVIDGQVLCVFNNSQTTRAPLALALSVNDCKSWEPLAILEEDATGGARVVVCSISCREHQGFSLLAVLAQQLLASVKWFLRFKSHKRVPVACSWPCRQLLLPQHCGVG
jgi:hypothetical protein